jgi:hypothetical protein
MEYKTLVYPRHPNGDCLLVSPRGQRVEIISFTSTEKRKCRTKHNCMQREREGVREGEDVRQGIIVATETRYCKERGRGTRPKKSRVDNMRTK